MKAAINVAIVIGTAAVIWWAMGTAYDMGRAFGRAEEQAHQDRVSAQMRDYGFCEWALRFAAFHQCPRAEWLPQTTPTKGD